MLLPKSICVCFKSVAPKCLYGQTTIFGSFWGGPDMKTEMGVVIFMYLKHSPEDIDSKYVWVHGSNSLGSSVFDEIPFLALHRERKRNGQVEPSPYYSLSQIVYT